MYEDDVMDNTPIVIEVPDKHQAQPVCKCNPINEALIVQMQNEKNNYYIYKNFVGVCEYKGLTGAAKYFRKQSEDELRHFNLIFDYLCDRVGFISELREIAPIPFDSSLYLCDMITQAFDLECKTTNNLTCIKRSAIEEGDFLTDSFLDQLMLEQIEEEKTSQDLLNRCRLFGDTPIGVMMLDQEMGND